MNESRRTLSPRARWTVPVVAAVAVGMAFVAPPLFASADDAGLPTITPEELAAQVASAEPSPLSGTVVYTARLGLPEIPFGAVAGADPINLLGGSSTMRVWSDGDQRSRVALLGPTSEYSVVQDGPEAWTYSSMDDAVVHYSLSAADQARFEALQAQAEAGDLPVQSDLPTPEEAGRQAVGLARTSSTVTLDSQTEVAGRAAYQLVVTPTSDTTLVGRIVVAVDAETSTPLRVQVWSTSDTETPALEIGFTDVSFATPADSVLAFSAPAGSSTRDVVVPLPEPPTEATTAPEDKELPEGVTITGTGWDTVVQASGLDVAALVAGDPAAAANLPGVDKTFGSQGAADLYAEFVPEEGSGSPMGDLDTTALYDTLTKPVPEGRLLSSALLSVLITDDGRVLAGAVPGATLQALAAQ